MFGVTPDSVEMYESENGNVDGDMRPAEIEDTYQAAPGSGSVFSFLKSS